MLSVKSSRVCISITLELNIYVIILRTLTLISFMHTKKSKNLFLNTNKYVNALVSKYSTIVLVFTVCCYKIQINLLILPELFDICTNIKYVIV